MDQTLSIVPEETALLIMDMQNGILDIWPIQIHYPDDRTRQTHKITPHTHRWRAGSPALKDTLGCGNC